MELLALPPTTLLAAPLPLVASPAMVWLMAPVPSPNWRRPLATALPRVTAVVDGRRLVPPEAMMDPS